MAGGRRNQSTIKPMNQDIHGPDVNERHERNKRAIAYLERLKARDEQHDAEKPGALTMIAKLCRDGGAKDL